MIKLIAILTMVIDHVGIFIFPQYSYLLRPIGAISFPLFAWMIVDGKNKTSNEKKYLQNLLLFAVISEPVFMFMFPGRLELNSLFTLFWGLFLVCAYERFGWLVFLGLIPLFNFNLISCYVVLIFLFYFAKEKPGLILLGSVLFFLFVTTWGPNYVIYGLLFYPIVQVEKFNFRVPINKYYFYSFYPVHFLIIYGVQYGLN
jgi:hypothetical protein